MNHLRRLTWAAAIVLGAVALSAVITRGDDSGGATPATQPATQPATVAATDADALRKLADQEVGVVGDVSVTVIDASK